MRRWQILAFLGFSIVSGLLGSISVSAAAPGNPVGSGCPLAMPCPKIVYIPGTASDTKIGSHDIEEDSLESEALHVVRIKPFFMGQTEVSVGQYMACVTAGDCKHPEWLEPNGEHNIETGNGITYKSMSASIKGDNQPVVGVNWDDATAYVAWLSKVTGKLYRLPSEAEWEYAARAGTQTRFWWGDEPRNRDKVMACCRGCGSEQDGKGLYPVESFEPNPFGLYNVHGNVWEWVADYFCDDYTSSPADGSPRTQKTCAKQNTPEGLRVFRGGSCFFEPRQMRSAMRLRQFPNFRNQTLGFRVAKDVEP